MVRPLKFKLSDPTLTSDVNQTLSSLFPIKAKVAPASFRSVSVGGGTTNVATKDVSLPLPDYSQFVLWTPQVGTTNYQAAWNLVNDTVLTSSSGGSGGSFSAGSAFPTASAAAAFTMLVNGDVGVSYGGQAAFTSLRPITFKTCIKAFFDINAVAANALFGLTNVNASATTLPTTGDFIGVQIIKAAGSDFGNLLLVCSTAGTITTVDSGIPASDPTGTAGIRYTIEVTVTPTGLVTLLVNGGTVAKCTTNVPNANALFIAWYVAANQVGLPDGSFFVNTEYLYAANLCPGLPYD